MVAEGRQKVAARACIPPDFAASERFAPHPGIRPGLLCAGMDLARNMWANRARQILAIAQVREECQQSKG